MDHGKGMQRSERSDLWNIIQNCLYNIEAEPETMKTVVNYIVITGGNFRIWKNGKVVFLEKLSVS